MIKNDEVNFDILINKFDRLQSTKNLIKITKLSLKKNSNNSFNKKFSNKNNYSKYKENFKNYLKNNDIRISYSDKYLLEHYNNIFNKNKSTIKKTKIFWLWISVCTILFITIVVLTILGTLDII